MLSFFAVYLLLAYLNIHYLIFLSMVHEYVYFYEYIWNSVHYCARKCDIGEKIRIICTLVFAFVQCILKTQIHCF